MPRQASLYDLMLVLSTTVEEEERAKIVSDVESQITSGDGVLERNDDWRTRTLAYEIRHQKEGEYHLLQFTGPSTLLDSLSHSLRINDSVLRFRIIKVRPGTPPPPDAAPPVAAPPVAAPPAATVPAATVPAAVES
jgi:small subunit ribosomal protein S6